MGCERPAYDLLIAGSEPAALSLAQAAQGATGDHRHFVIDRRGPGNVHFEEYW